MMDSEYGSLHSYMRRGFALPTVLIASVVMLMILVTGVSAVVAVRASLNQQHYDQLANAAAEAGTVLARACLQASNNVANWTDAAPLKPNTDCSGVPNGSLSAYVLETENYRTYFEVGKPADGGGPRAIAASSKGYIEVLRSSSGTAWRIFSSNDAMATAIPTSGGTPVGTSIEGYWKDGIPEGYLEENGEPVSRVTYAALYEVIGTQYGDGDGSTTFNLPDSRGRVLVAQGGSPEFTNLGTTGGATTHTLSIAEMPSHTHTQNAHTHTQNAHTHTLANSTVASSSHSHALSDLGQAKITLTSVAGSQIRYSSVSMPAWNSDFTITATNRAASVQSSSSGTGLAGSTNSNSSTTTVSANSSTASNQNTTAVNQNNGGGGAHNNTQPYIVLRRAIKF